MSKNVINLAFIADRNILEGLHVSVYSALKKIRSKEVSISIITKDIRYDDLKVIKKSLKKTKKNYSINLINAKEEIEEYKNLCDNKMHGSYLTYLKYEMPHLVSGKKILYLDADTIVNCDISKMFDYRLGKRAIGAVRSGKARNKIDWEFTKNFLNADDEYYNAGIILINSDQWRKNEITTAAKEFIKKHAPRLESHDQSVLNTRFRHTVSTLPSKYNIPCYPGKDISDLDKNGILHFVGSPKPWDLGGEIFHASAHLFKEEVRKTSLSGWSSIDSISMSKILRTLYILKSYFKNASLREVIKNLKKLPQK